MRTSKFESAVFYPLLFECTMPNWVWTLLRLVIPHCESSVLKVLSATSKRLRAYVYTNYYLREAMIREGRAYAQYFVSLRFDGGKRDLRYADILHLSRKRVDRR